ncbi:hypothetical protein DFH09DRAFT_1310609 [Mycena vulgaris]|nr:hypothetical protein DFH09DRAFT_1310609 [Mycena vulgaris]
MAITERRSWGTVSDSEPGLQQGVFTNQIGTGNKCFIGAGTKINSMSWTNTASKRAVDAVDGVQPNTLKFAVEGVEKALQIPAGEGAIDTMLALFQAGNFTGLEAYAGAN